MWSSSSKTQEIIKIDLPIMENTDVQKAFASFYNTLSDMRDLPPLDRHKSTWVYAELNAIAEWSKILESTSDWGQDVSSASCFQNTMSRFYFDCCKSSGKLDINKVQALMRLFYTIAALDARITSRIFAVLFQNEVFGALVSKNFMNIICTMHKSNDGRLTAFVAALEGIQSEYTRSGVLGYFNKGASQAAKVKEISSLLEHLRDRVYSNSDFAFGNNSRSVYSMRRYFHVCRLAKLTKEERQLVDGEKGYGASVNTALRDFGSVIVWTLENAEVASFLKNRCPKELENQSSSSASNDVNASQNSSLQCSSTTYGNQKVVNSARYHEDSRDERKSDCNL